MSSHPRPFQEKLPLASIATLLLAICLLPWVLPRLYPVCKILRNCASDQKYQQTYDEIVRQVNEVHTLPDHQERDYLHNKRQILQQAITSLSDIPSDAQINTTVKNKISDYQDELTEIEQHLGDKTEKQQQFEAANNIVIAARNKTENAKYIPALEEAQTLWQEAQKQLAQLATYPEFVDQTNPLLEECQENLIKIDKLIDKRLAEMDKRQRQAEREQANKEIRKNYYKQSSGYSSRNR